MLPLATTQGTHVWHILFYINDQKLFTIIERAETFFRNSSNMTILKKSIKDLLQKSCHMTLLYMCKTCWVYKHEAVLCFKEIYAATVNTLLELEGSVNLSRDAHQLSHVLYDPKYIY